MPKKQALPDKDTLTLGQSIQVKQYTILGFKYIPNVLKNRMRPLSQTPPTVSQKYQNKMGFVDLSSSHRNSPSITPCPFLLGVHHSQQWPDQESLLTPPFNEQPIAIL